MATIQMRELPRNKSTLQVFIINKGEQVYYETIFSTLLNSTIYLWIRVVDNVAHRKLNKAYTHMVPRVSHSLAKKLRPLRRNQLAVV